MTAQVKNAEWLEEIRTMQDGGATETEIANHFGFGSVRQLRLAVGIAVKSQGDPLGTTNLVVDTLKKQIERDNFIDVSKGAEDILGVSQMKLHLALSTLEIEGYKTVYVKMTQADTDKVRVYKILTNKKTYNEARDALSSGGVAKIDIS